MPDALPLTRIAALRGADVAAAAVTLRVCDYRAPSKLLSMPFSAFRVPSVPNSEQPARLHFSTFLSVEKEKRSLQVLI